MKKAAQLGMGCDIIPAVTLDGITVSSTLQSAPCWSGGNVEEAARFPGRALRPSPAGSAHRPAAWAPRLGAPTPERDPAAGARPCPPTACT